MLLSTRSKPTSKCGKADPPPPSAARCRLSHDLCRDAGSTDAKPTCPPCSFLAFAPADVQGQFVSVDDAVSGQLLLADGFKHKVFVKGVFVQELKGLQCGVNVRGDFNIGRDRNAVNIDACTKAIAKIWGAALLQESKVVGRGGQTSAAAAAAGTSEPPPPQKKARLDPDAVAATAFRVSNTMLELLRWDELPADCTDVRSVWDEAVCSTISAAFTRAHGDGATPIAEASVETKALWPLLVDVGGTCMDLVTTPTLLEAILAKGGRKTALQRLEAEGLDLMEADPIPLGSLSLAEKTAWEYLQKEMTVYNLGTELVIKDTERVIKDHGGCLAWIDLEGTHRSDTDVFISKTLLGRGRKELHATVILLAKYRCKKRGLPFTEYLIKVIQSPYFQERAPPPPELEAAAANSAESVCTVCSERKQTLSCPDCTSNGKPAVRCCSHDCFEKHRSDGTCSADADDASASDGEAGATSDPEGLSSAEERQAQRPKRHSKRRSHGVPTDIVIRASRQQMYHLEYSAKLTWAGGQTDGYKWFEANELRDLDNKVRGAPFILHVMQRFDDQESDDDTDDDTAPTGKSKRAVAHITRELLQEDGARLLLASKAQRADPNLVSAAVKQNGLALEHADPSLQNDATLVFAAVKQNGLALEHADLSLRDNARVVDAAVTQNGRAVRFATLALQTTGKVVLTAFLQDQTSLQCTKDGLEVLHREVGRLKAEHLQLTQVVVEDVETGSREKQQLPVEEVLELNKRRLEHGPAQMQGRVGEVETTNQQLQDIKTEKALAKKARDAAVEDSVDTKDDYQYLITFSGRQTKAIENLQKFCIGLGGEPSDVNEIIMAELNPTK